MKIYVKSPDLVDPETLGTDKINQYLTNLFSMMIRQRSIFLVRFINFHYVFQRFFQTLYIIWWW